MMDVFVAYTSEIDDVDYAIQSLKEQIPAERLKKNTVGILACHYEFVLSGASEAIGAAFPFDIVGTITSAQATPDVADSLILTMTILTSDDVVFRTACSESLLSEPKDAVRAMYAKAALPNDAPALVLAFSAFIPQNSGDDYVDTLTECSGGAPCFGTLAVDDTPTFEHCYMLYNGESYHDRMSVLLMYGDVKPKFYIATLSPDKIHERSAMITKSHGHIVEEVNGKPILAYFDSFGLAEASESSYAFSSIPFLLDINDGTPPVSRVFISLTEDKHGLFAGRMPEGATIRMGIFSHDDVLVTTEAAIRRALDETPDASGVLIYSCVARIMTLGADNLAELSLAKELFTNKAPFMAAYSGGELCPTALLHTEANNRFHNNSIIICVF